MSLLKVIEGAALGKPFWMDVVRLLLPTSSICHSLIPASVHQQHYYKAYAYRVEPASPTGFLSIDGESFPLEPYELEVHQGLGCFLSLYGRYNAEFDLPPPEEADKGRK